MGMEDEKVDENRWRDGESGRWIMKALNMEVYSRGLDSSFFLLG